MKDKFEQPIKLVNAWYCRNSLLINPDKTKVVAVGVSQVPQRLPSFRAILLDEEISVVPIVKGLGVQLNESLYHNQHITKTVSVCLNHAKQKNLSDRKMLLLLEVCMCVMFVYYMYH